MTSEFAYLSESAFISGYQPLMLDGSPAASLREAMSPASELQRLREMMTDALTLWSVIATPSAYVATKEARVDAIGYFLAGKPGTHQPVRALLEDSAYCLLWHALDAKQEPFVTAALTIAEAKEHLIEAVPNLLFREDAQLNADYFIDAAYVITLSSADAVGARLVNHRE